MTSPVVGATKLHHVEGAVKAVDLELTAEDLDYLEELYGPHPLVGVMAQNTRGADKKKQVWMQIEKGNWCCLMVGTSFLAHGGIRNKKWDYGLSFSEHLRISS